MLGNWKRLNWKMEMVNGNGNGNGKGRGKWKGSSVRFYFQRYKAGQVVQWSSQLAHQPWLRMLRIARLREQSAQPATLGVWLHNTTVTTALAVSMERKPGQVVWKLIEVVDEVYICWLLPYWKATRITVWGANCCPSQKLRLWCIGQRDP